MLRVAFPPQGSTPSDGLTTMPGRGQTSSTCGVKARSGYELRICAHAWMHVCVGVCACGGTLK